MSSQIDIINLAVALYGGEKLASLSDNSKSAKLAKTHFKGSTLAMFNLPYDWKFATARAQLGRTTDPDFGRYSYQYLLPAKYIRMISTIDQYDDNVEFQYRRELFVDAGNKEHAVILTNETTCRIKYIREVVDIGRWPEWFARLVALDLGTILNTPVAQDKVQKNQLWQQATDPIHGWLAQARKANALEDMDISDDFVDLDKGNNDVIDATQSSSVTGSRIIQRE